MELLLKVKNKYAKNHDNYLSGWKDGQVIDMRPDGFHTGKLIRKNHFVLRTQHDFWALRGTTDSREDWKSTIGKVYDLKKWLSVSDSSGKFAWEAGYKEDGTRKRDWFVDFKDWLDKGWITQAQFDSIYNPAINHSDIYFDRDMGLYLFDEETKIRKMSDYSEAVNSVEFISSGTFSIGSGLDYNTVAAFEAAIDATLTGDLTGEHADEETSVGQLIAFSIDTATFLLKLTAASGAEHSGAVYGNGARINYGTSDRIRFDEVISNTFDNLEVSKLALDISGAGNSGINLRDGAVGGTWTVNRMLIKGDSNTGEGIFHHQQANGTIIIINNNIYGLSSTFGIRIANASPDTPDITCANNTVTKCSEGILQFDTGALSGTLILKNNLCQGNTTDYSDNGAGFGTTAKNISEDATSPDASYRSKDLHTNSIFLDYVNDDYRLDSGGDATNLAIVDDGENLYGSGVTEDIAGQARDNGTPFWIGASHLTAVAEVVGISVMREAFVMGVIPWQYGQHDMGFIRTDWGTVVTVNVFTGSVADGITFGDTRINIATLLNTLTDGTLFGDTPSANAVFVSAVIDSTKFGDTSSSQIVLLVSLVDGVAAGDTVTDIANLLNSLSDKVNFGDSLVSIATMLGNITDSTRFGDAPVGNAVMLSSVVDGTKFSDVIEGDVALLVSMTDGVRLGDSTSTIATLLGSMSDGILLEDTPTVIATLLGSIVDGTRFGDGAVGDIIILVSVSDGLSLGDTPTTIANFSTTLTDGIDMSDTPINIASLITSLIDGVKFSDVIGRSLTINVALDDGTNFGDTISALATLSVSIVDSVNFSDTVTNIATIMASITDGMTFSDVVLAVGGLVATGEVTATFTVKGATITFTVKCPGTDFTV